MKVMIQLGSGMHWEVRVCNPHVPRKRHTKIQVHDWHKQHAQDSIKCLAKMISEKYKEQEGVVSFPDGKAQWATYIFNQ